ncbi:MAG: nickel ABC transporter substrate-binding protein [Spirochaetaceae bacterium]|jgi:nickel transport system substrate-binding protein|nr:nickel ABC transporter substrate-binding protein [Spirochaetaceae bacterium]
MRGKSWMSLAALVLMAGLLVSGCNGKGKSDSTAGKNSPVKKELVYAAPTELGDINVHLYAGEMIAQDMVFEPLIDNTPEGFAPAMAESWEISPDGKEFVFHLRKGLTFHDGEPFNATAVKLNFDALMSNIDWHTWLGLPNKIKSYEALDEYTFRLVLTEAYYPALIELGLTRPFRFISPKCFIDGETKNGVSGHAGTGPWILKEHVPNDYAVFVANPDYYKGKPEIEKLTRRVLPIGATTLLALEKGELDILFTNWGADMFDADALAQIMKSDKYQVVRSDPVATKMLIVNTNNTASPIKDIPVRLAIWYALDRNQIARDISKGMDLPADTYFAPNIPYADIPLEKRPVDIEKAKQLLDEAGWVQNGEYRSKNGRPLEITLNYTVTKAGEKPVCEYIQSQCKKIGVKVNVEGVEQVLRVLRFTPEFELLYDYSQGLPYDPHNSLLGLNAEDTYLGATKGLENFTEIMANVNAAVAEFNEEKRQEFYTYVLKEIHRQALFIPLTYESITFIAPPYLNNIGFNQTMWEIPFEQITYRR